MSLGDGECVGEDVATTSLLESIVDAILRKTLRVQHIISSCVDLTNDLQAEELDIVSCGSSAVQESLIASLRESAGATVNVYDATLPPIPDPVDLSRTSRKPKLAVVGMAGRFPDAADHEKFWDILEAGQDVHRRVRLLSFALNVVVLLLADGIEGPQRSL